MKRIPLTQGLSAIVDDEDFEMLSRFKWHFHQTGYAMRTARIDGKKHLLRMHRVVMNAPPHKCVDHINGNTLDNRKRNLRIASRSQNQHNRGRNKNNTSGFKGVSRYRGRWRARITVNWKEIRLGIFDTPEEAFDAYVAAAKEYHGEFANDGF